VRLRDDGQPADTVGAGRYILSFLLAGVIGLAIQYWTRDYGWRGVIINSILFILIVAFVVFFAAWETGGSTCQNEFGNPC
jgi:hypothetical protein